ncbi:MAG TPA: SH3 domain-containing protein [Bryobacteraceae bacterium]|nr:SH3 domain-containing protein [Bryobacteraceae bacterium]
MIAKSLQISATVLPVLLLLSSCGPQALEKAPVIGEAWAGPAALTLHREIDPKSPAAATVKHGEHLDIVGQRRRWYRVRTPQGVEGWTDDRQLMDGNQMKRLLALAKETADLPSQGAATTFDSLNVHSEPNRLSASFIQVKEGEKFDVIAHRVFARGPLPRRQLLPPKPKAEKPAKKVKKEFVPPPPPPQPPNPPPDWVELSKQSASVPEEDLPAVARDDWTLIRTQNGQSGWVLTGRVYMSIPDEVAQYAEGHRITSYFSLGKIVSKEDEPKDIWLWTTATGLGLDHDFDGYRVFTWNTRRHRYETAYIQRRIRGYFPTLVKGDQFSVCLEREDGSVVRKRYAMVGNLVRGVGETGCERPTAAIEPSPDAKIELHPQQPPPAPRTFADRVKDQYHKLVGR